jgi:phosphoribosylformylglycinamidine synthase
LPSDGALAFAIRDVGPARLALHSILLRGGGGGGRVKARIHVTLKKGILDPQGKAIEHALETLGFKMARNVRMGKYLELDVNEPDRDKAEAQVKAMCDKLLANTIIEEYRYELS